MDKITKDDGVNSVRALRGTIDDLLMRCGQRMVEYRHTIGAMEVRIAELEVQLDAERAVNTAQMRDRMSESDRWDNRAITRQQNVVRLAKAAADHISHGRYAIALCLLQPLMEGNHDVNRYTPATDRRRETRREDAPSPHAHTRLDWQGVPYVGVYFNERE